MNNKIDTSLNKDWMTIIWDWADKYQLDEEMIPRNKADLLSLTTLNIDTTYEYAGYYANCDRPPDDYYTTPLYSIEEVPEELACLPRLEDVYFSNVDANKFIEKISQLTHLKSLDTFAAKIRKLPEDINKLQKLESLYIWGDELKELPENICQINTLKSLLIRSASLQNLPINLNLLQNLESLEFESNYIVDIPSSVFKLSGLQALSIRGDQIEEIPTTIIGLEGLKYLELFTKNLTAISANIAKLPNLEFIKTYSSLWPILSDYIDESKVEVMLI